MNGKKLFKYNTNMARGSFVQFMFSKNGHQGLSFGATRSEKICAWFSDFVSELCQNWHLGFWIFDAILRSMSV